MTKQILFLQGGGDNGYDTDAAIVESLKTALGENYIINYPRLQSDESQPDYGWLKQIGDELAAIKSPLIVIAHSLGASMLLKYLSENKVANDFEGIFLLATPLWDGDEDWQKPFKLRDDFAQNLPTACPIFLYHCRDDEEVPFDHLSFYAQKLPRAVIREIEAGGHQFQNDVAIVMNDIRKL